MSAYADAVEAAKKELDSILPEYTKMVEWVSLLRTLVVTGTKLIGEDARELDDKYKHPSMVKSEMGFSGHHRKPQHQHSRR